METIVSCQFRFLAPSQAPKPITAIPSRPSKTPARCLPLLGKSKRAAQDSVNGEDDYGIPANQVKTLAKFKSLHNHIRVLQVSRRADHPLAGSRLLLLDRPGNIHSISFLLHPFTSSYFDVFATLPPLLPPGPIALLGFGAGSAARVLLHIYPDIEIHGWEIDPSVIAVAREFFGLEKLEKQHRVNLSVHVGDALDETAGGERFAGIFVDLFQKGSLLPELQDPETWRNLRRRLKKGGRVMANCGGKCVEAEDSRRDGETVMEETVKSMRSAFGAAAEDVFVLMLEYGESEGCVAMTGPWPKDTEKWKLALPKPLRGYVDRWKPFTG
ncbi:hypothetical protein KSP39_PZI008465 [Platanthera zijinensis]|uniref:S-adenosyl-L-methionine-dependent methyltransferase n=1 Tax=Platanthera zijinensis TaxID=2320716 RepID=A0AAP0G8M5_9ASPA